jgi:hypothetical protein
MDTKFLCNNILKLTDPELKIKLFIHGEIKGKSFNRNTAHTLGFFGIFPLIILLT